MKIWMRIVGLCVSAAAIAACSAADTGVSENEDTDLQDDSIYAASSLLWKTKSIPVCWENPGNNATQRTWVKDQITKTWDTASSLDFTGWQTCAATSSGIRIRIEDSGPHTKGLGTQLDGVSAGMVLNFTFKNWSTSCQGQEESCIRSIAVHEFGHAIGFGHEQNREDTPSSCTAEPQGSDGDLVIGAWDLSSVMNYCNPEYNGNGNLSKTDLDAVRLAYDTGLSGLIVNEHDDKCLEVSNASTTNGASIVAWPCKGGNNQRWNFVKRADGNYQIVNRNSGKCLAVAGSSTANGALIQQVSCGSGDNQAWAIETSGVTRLRAKHSGKCLDLTKSSQVNGVKMQQWGCGTNANQRFSLKK